MTKQVNQTKKIPEIEKMKQNEKKLFIDCKQENALNKVPYHFFQTMLHNQTAKLPIDKTISTTKTQK